MRFTSLIIALLMLCSCGETAVQPQNTDASDSGEITTSAPEQDVYPYETKDYGGRTFTILNCVDELWSGSNHVIDYESLTGENVSDSIYERARETEQLFGVKLEIIKDEILDIYPDIQKNVLAGEYFCDAAYAPLFNTMTGEYAVNLFDIDALHLDEDWWNGNFIEQATLLGDKLYSTIDYVNMMGYTYGNVMYFNKDMMSDHNLDMPYDLIRIGEWTYDRMNEYMSQVVSLNGDDSFAPSMSGSCVYGFAVQHEEGTMSLLNGSGEMLTAKNNEGIPEIRSNVERFSTAYAKLCQILSQDGYAVMKNEKELQGELIFKAQRALFYQGNLGLSGSSFREFTFEYGVIPLPKLDSAQENYYTMASEYTLSLLIPKTAEDTDFSGRIIDYMAYIGKRDVIPALQLQLCYKGMRDDDSIEMFETILGTLSLDIGYMFGWTKSLLRTLCGSDMLNGNDSFASSFASQKDSITANIEKTIETMREE